MPITVHAKTSIENQEVREQLERLYDTSPEFGDGKDAIEQLEQNLTHYTLLYVAEFNTKVIGALWCTGQGESKVLENIVVHPANRGRGVAERLVEEVCRIEEEKGVKTFEPGCGAIHRCLAHLGKI
ncbi:N-acetyltransferase [Acinetobacter wuhouensis]|uniref:N-acetyltransferase n=1 Tax=Acinetobacter wuhouensis TaxID=1879050 RepID=A0A385C7N9_9GAMM|nr:MULTISPECIES: GNAT family N-acetyltransferase [Acinetobacter]AXQ23741.1 N-acetyltransferase [Acinetobacter wuhouensis]AYO52972.1 N-acetyltransferase [Acinetobacter wuhouensis]RZG47260.1 N-acetyltransferase [Acinetobacter wuhouensis]RZG73249.1 N-acetyltransferase [Acinetobacter wuhouensis]RZG78196.1 N-acetyltransferase [Acinetobacter sp. WCHAc060025]